MSQWRLGHERERSVMVAGDDVSVASSTSVRGALGHQFAVATPDPALTGYLEELFASLGPATAGAPHHRYEVVGPDPEGRWTARRDGVDVEGPTSRSRALALLLWRLNRSVVEDAAGQVLLHAGGVRMGGTTVLLPGDMEVGKTTLVAGLLRAGADYLSDEAVGIDLDSDLVHGFAKALSLDPGSWSLFPELEPDVPAEVRRWLPAQWQVPPTAYGGSVVPSSRAGLVVFPAYRAGAATELVPLPGSDALVRLRGCVFPTELPQVAILQRLARLLDDAPGYALVSGSLGEAVAAVRALVGAQADPTGVERSDPTTAAGPVVDLPDPQVPGPPHRDGGDPRSAVDLHRPIRRRPAVTLLVVQGETVLHDATSDELVRLNLIGAAVWDRLDGRTSATEVADDLVAATDAPETDVHRGVGTFVADLVARGLVDLG